MSLEPTLQGAECWCVTFVPQAIEIFGNFSTPFGTWLSLDIQVKIYGARPWETPPSGKLNTRGVADRPLSRAAVRFPAGANQIRLARRPAPTKIRLAAAPNFSGGGGGIRRQFVSVHIKGQIK